MENTHDEDIVPLSELESLSKEEISELEELAKKCPRCGASTAGKAQRCAKHLKQLRENKKKPGHWQRAQTKADDALRRQKGKNGTAHKKSSGLGNRASIVRQTKAAEQKTGQKLSPDRKNNEKGYAAANTRMVPENLNRGRHKVDPKKLRAWKKRLKKSNIDSELFYTALLAKANQIGDTALLEMLGNLNEEGLMKYVDIFDRPMQPKVLPSEKVAYFDVNQTLLHRSKVRGPGAIKIGGISKDANGIHYPNKENIELLKQLKSQGYAIVVWSGEGWKMAKVAVDALGLHPWVDLILSKPSIYVDNEDASDFMTHRVWNNKKES